MIPGVGRLGILACLSPLLLALAPPPTPARAEGTAAGATPTPVIRARPLQGLRADVAALILNGREGGALWAALLATPLPGADGKGRVALWIELDGARLQRVDEGEAAPQRLKIEVHVYALRTSGGLAGSLSQSFRIPAGDLGAVVAHGGVKYSAHLDLEPGSYELRVLIRETETQRYALRVLPMRVPSPEGDMLLVGPPFFPDVEEAWIKAHSAEDSPRIALQGTGLPVPSALPVLAAGRPRQAKIPIHAADAGKLNRLKVSARLLDGKRQGVGKIDAHWVEERGEQNRESGSGGFRFPELRLELPDDLLTGNYFLETSVAERGRGAAAGRGTTTTQIYVLGLERTETDVVWTDLQHLASLSSRRREALGLAAERQREALDLAAERRASERVDAIAEAYRGVLEILVSGSVDEAAVELDRLETEVLKADPVEGRAWLGGGQDQVLDALSRGNAESLIPVLLLHMERHDGYVREHRRTLTFHARERVINTARRYVESADSELAPALAAGALADMGIALARGNMRVAARRMMEESVALDEHNLTSILGLAVDHEKRGESQQAVLQLRRLLALDPSSEEGRLRLALSLQRAGETAEAGRQLRRVLADVNTEWLLSLAYQRQVENLLAEQRVSQAIQVLEMAVERLPAQKRLYILLAYTLDRSGESRQAREVLRRMPAGSSGLGSADLDSADMSPRLRYSRHFPGSRESTRPELLRQSMARLTILADALASKPEPNKKSGRKPEKKPGRKP